MSTGRRGGCLRTIFGLLLVCIAVVYGVAALTSPWAFHIGGRWTPLLYWSGRGNLVTKTGTYPLYVSFFPGSHFSRLRLDGLRPTGGLQGSGTLCTSPGVLQPLKLSGTIYGAWTSTDGSLMEFRLLEQRAFNHQREGYFNLYGRWRGTQLVMEDRGEPGRPFPSGVNIEHASVVLDWGAYSDFKSLCATAPNSPLKRSSSQPFNPGFPQNSGAPTLVEEGGTPHKSGQLTLILQHSQTQETPSKMRTSRSTAPSSIFKAD